MNLGGNNSTYDSSQREKNLFKQAGVKSCNATLPNRIRPHSAWCIGVVILLLRCLLAWAAQCIYCVFNSGTQS